MGAINSLRAHLARKTPAKRKIESKIDNVNRTGQDHANVTDSEPEEPDLSLHVLLHVLLLRIRVFWHWEVADLEIS
jgi:hypothetical protein